MSAPERTQTQFPVEQSTGSADGDAAVTADGLDSAIPPPAPHPPSVRYDLGAEIARGGMGVVYRATDTAFDREVAVKVLLDKYAPMSGTARRFHDEARITGQLQHPGIPPAHDLGTLPDGRQFLAMKLIKGDTLEDLLRQRSDPAPDRGRFVAAFEKVCEAVAYAHAHDVVHRDLKPQNVMVGAFGEVQVMDWGLAKVLASRERERPEDDPDATTGTGTEVKSLRDSEDLLTQAGSVLGTPAYMPPEQAVGAVHEINARSDVFGLGGILAAILTGRPPFVGDTAETTRVMAARGEVGDCFARLEVCGADPELVALCKRCLAPKRDDRPADAGQVAKAVATLRAAADERARQAELDKVRVEGEKAAAEAQAAERRKRRRVWVGAGACVAVVVVVALAGVVAVEVRRSGQLRAERDAARDAEAEAAEQRRLAQTRLEQGVAAVEGVILRVAGEKWASRPELLAERQQVLIEAVAFFNSLGSTGSRDPAVRRQAARANLFAADAARSLGEYEKMVAAASAAQSLYRGLKDEFPDDTAYLCGEAEAVEYLGIAAGLRAKDTDALARYQEALALAEAAVAKQPDRADNQLALAEVYSSLAHYYRLQRRDLSREYQDKCVVVGQKLLESPTPDYRARVTVALAQVNLGISSLVNNRAEALRRFDAADVQLRRLADATPPSARVVEHYLMAKGSLAVYRGRIMVEDGDVDAGLALVRDGVDTYARMAALQPKSFGPAYNHLQMFSHYVTLLYRNKRQAAAEAALDELLARLPAVISAHPQQRAIFQRLGQEPRSQLLIDRVLKSLSPDDLADADRLSTELGRDVPYSWHCVALAFSAASDLSPPVDREEYAVRAVRHYEGLLASTRHFHTGTIAGWTDNTTLRRPIRRRADFQAFLGKMREARSPGVTAQARLIESLVWTGHGAAAVCVLQGLARRHPKDPDFHHHLGAILRDRGLSAYAELALREAVRQTGDQHGYAHDALAELLTSRGDLDAPLAVQKDIVRYKPGDKDAAERLVRLGRMRPLLPRLPGVLAGTDRPSTPAETVAFADLCGQPFQEWYATAARLFGEAFAADPELAAARGGEDRDLAATAAIRAAAGDGADAPADPEARAALRGQALTWLRATLVSQQKNAASSSWTARSEAAKKLAGWLTDLDLAWTRPGEPRLSMSPAERAEWDRFWKDVKAANVEARSAPPPLPVAPPPRAVTR